MIALDFTFTAKLWRWKGGSWHFVTLPQDVSADIKAFGSDTRRGFGSVRVDVRSGDEAWATSLFPSKENAAYLLPVKASIRDALGVAAGDELNLTVTLDP